MSDDLEKLKKENEELKDKINLLKTEISNLEFNLQFKDEDVFYLQHHQDNIITRSVIEILFENIDNIPMQELETLINKYKK